MCSTCVQKKKKEKWVPPKMTRVGKRKKGSGPQAAYKLPAALPVSKCKLRLLRLERIKDFLLLEEEFLANQAARKPREQQDEEDKSRVDEIRGSPMSVATIEELIDDNHAIISSTNGPEYYVRTNSEKKEQGMRGEVGESLMRMTFRARTPRSLFPLLSLLCCAPPLLFNR